MMRYVLLSILLPAAALLVVGCEKGNSTKLKEAAKTPLEFDPTEQYDLPHWWTNGDELLYLNETGYYALYPGTNRYASPQERGRWGRQNYAALWLEPYEAIQGERARASIRKIDDDLVLQYRALDPMLGVDGPPPVIEDRLIGRWRGPSGSLQLRDNMRYVFSPRPDLPQQPAALAGHEGRWQVTDGALVLRPDSPGVPPSRMQIIDTGGKVVIEAETGTLERE